MAVIAMASSKGKKKIKTGVNSVPSPKPLKNVSREVKNPTIARITYSIL